MNQFRQGIGYTARADIVDGKNRIGLAHLPAAVDHFLGTTLHFRVAALHRIEIQILGIGAGIHAGSRTAAQTDQHAGATQAGSAVRRV